MPFTPFSLATSMLLLSLTTPFLSPTLTFEYSAVQAQTLQDQKVEEFRLYLEGIKQFEKNQYREALEKFEQALVISKEMGDWERQGRTLRYIGFIYFTLEDYPQALEFYQQALAAYKAIGENDKNGEILLDSVYKNDEASLLNNIGSVYSNLGEYELALKFQQKTLEITRYTGNLALEKTALNNIGLTYSNLGDYALALDFLQQALAMHSQVVDNSNTGVNQYNIGLIYLKLGNDKKALEFLEETLKIVRKLNNKAGEVRTLNVIGNVYSRREKYQLALNFYQQALELSKIIDKPLLLGATLSNIGRIYYHLEQNERALNFYQKSLAIYQQMGDKDGEGVILDNIGESHFQLGQYSTALSHYQQALAINKASGNKAEEGENLSNIGYLFKQQNQSKLAIIFFKQALNTREEIRQNIVKLPQEVQKSYTETIADDYRALADLLLQEDRVLEAQRVLDLLKVEELNEYLQNVRGNANTTQGIPNTQTEQKIWSSYADLTNQAVKIGQELSQLRNQQTRTPQQEKRIAQLIAGQEEILRQFNAFIDSPEVQANLEKLSRTAQRQNIDLEQLNALQDNLENLNQNAVLFYPLILEDRLELILVTPHSPPIRRTVPVGREQLNKAVVEMRLAVQNPTQNAQKPAQQLYDWLIKPLETDLAAAGAETIVYAPDGQLRYIPLAALYDGERWLVERFRINIITAASLTDINSQPPTQPRILAGAFANVTYSVQVGEEEFFFQALPFAGTEVKNLAEIVSQTTLLFDQTFSRDQTLLKMDDYNIVHFATHGAFVSGSPQDSFILFGDGKISTLNEIKNWSLKNVDLVVLSACQTGLGGQFDDGEEILGLGYQFQRAGARAVIASLWSVDDGGTQMLMNGFYEALQQAEMTKAEALRQAQIALITGNDSAFGGERGVAVVRSVNDGELQETNRLSHPFYWASFILIGNGL